MSLLFVTVLLAVASMATAEPPLCTTQSIGFLDGDFLDRKEIIPAYQPSGRTDLRICGPGQVANGVIVTACDCDSPPDVKLFNNDYDIEYGDVRRSGAFKCVATVEKTVFCGDQSDVRARGAGGSSQMNARAQARSANSALPLVAN